ncbi:hypothetical protein BH11PSE2_BH11PSE2_11950 [soil metagenome]
MSEGREANSITGAPALPGPPWRAVHSVRGRLMLLTLTLILAAAIGAWLLLADAARLHRTSTELQLAETARALSLDMDGEVGKVDATLRALAMSPRLQTGDIAGFEPLARAVMTDQDEWIVVYDKTGATVLDTSHPPGGVMPSAPAVDFAERWRRLSADDQIVSDLNQRAAAPRFFVAIDRLVRDPTGQPIYDIAVLMRPVIAQRLLQRQGLPDGWYGGLIDGKGQLIARHADSDRYVGRLATSDMRKHIAASRRGVFESQALDGAKTLAAYDKSPLTNWTFSVAMPRKEATGYLSQSLVYLGLVVIGLLILAAGLSLLFARGVVRAVDTLADAAGRLGRGDIPTSVETGLDETNTVAAALHASALRLQGRENELRGLNETLEARVEEATARLVQAQKLEAVGRLTGGVAHDFNNLLTAVIGNLELLSRKLTDEKLSRYVASARAAAERGAKLTAQLLAFSRQQRLTPEPTDINAVIHGMSELLATTLGGATHIEMDLDEHLPQAVADLTQLELMILNLSINARDAMPGGGVMRIETRRRTITAAADRPEHAPPGDYVVVTVADQGFGMTEAILARAFEPFFTTKGPGRGSGLGLPQVLGVVQQLGGGMEVKSAPGEGARVSLFLPIALTQGGASTSSGDIEPLAIEVAGMAVLLVDDDADVRAAGAALLREVGCVVTEAHDGASALALLDKGLLVDRVLLDYAMPGMTGVELARRIRARRPGLPLVLISGYIDAGDVALDWTGPILHKPYSAEALIRTLGADEAAS